MSTAIDTGKVGERRKLHFAQLEEIRAEVEQLAQARALRPLGNWSAGQIFKHLANTMNKCIDGFEHPLPRPLRFVVRLLFKRKFLTQPMKAGFQLPRKAATELIPSATTLEEGLRSLRQALDRLQVETQRALNPVLGPLTRDEWDQVHCRHAELHLSFLVPVL
jgi:hypothetical protein